ncbi:hypothetical protein B4113_2029 [Geobacillus sp. B4113_201601]|nr:hypothetical protein B4113_2029 [Geobacillus sp. B4113_201601]
MSFYRTYEGLKLSHVWSKPAAGRGFYRTYEGLKQYCQYYFWHSVTIVFIVPMRD